jgi:hypothetical protein
MKYGIYKMSEWISVKDRLPAQDINVFVYDQVSHQFGISSLSIEMGDAEHGDNKLYCVWEDLQFHDRDEPTHWMPLPNPPKEEV